MRDFAIAPRSTRVRARGQITIPRDIREEMNLDELATVNIFRVGKALVMTTKPLQRSSLAKKVEREMKRQGLSLDDLLVDLRAQRKRYLEEAGEKD